MNAKAALRLDLTGLCVGALCAVLSGPGLAAADHSELTPMVLIPEGVYTPFTKSTRGAPEMRVRSFLIDEYPVTNAQFLDFVRDCPKWRRSEVARIFADSTYLQNWAEDLMLGPRAPAAAPVVNVSWFAARAYARWAGKRLPTTAEWEHAAACGYTDADGRNDPQLNRDLYAWLGQPTPEILPSVETSRANFYGVHGMHGLVWEWVEDFGAAIDSGGDTGLYCAAGASNVKDTGDYAGFMRQALRSSLKARNSTTSLGFRCVRDAAIPTFTNKGKS